MNEIITRIKQIQAEAKSFIEKKSGKWVKEILEQYPIADPNILDFIFRTTYQPNPETLEYEQTIACHYSAGYCYYFAVILQLNFGGEIRWLKNRSHIVWEDTRTNILYDCWGVFVDYQDEEIVPVELLGDCIELYKHGIAYRWSEDTIRQKQLELQKRINEYEKKHNHELTSFYKNYYDNMKG